MVLLNYVLVRTVKHITKIVQIVQFVLSKKAAMILNFCLIREKIATISC